MVAKTNLLTLCCLLLTVPVLSPAGAIFDHGAGGAALDLLAGKSACSETDYGFGAESPECQYACKAGDKLSVAVETSGLETDNYLLEADTSCGNAEAECETSTKSYCSSMSSTSAGAADDGDCEAEVTAAWNDYYTITVSCIAAVEESQNVQMGPISDALAAPGKPPGPTLLAAPPGVSSVAQRTLTHEGLVAGFSCRAIAEGLLACYGVA